MSPARRPRAAAPLLLALTQHLRPALAQKSTPEPADRDPAADDDGSNSGYDWKFFLGVIALIIFIVLTSIRCATRVLARRAARRDPAAILPPAGLSRPPPPAAPQPVRMELASDDGRRHVVYAYPVGAGGAQTPPPPEEPAARRPAFDAENLNSFEVGDKQRDEACPICLGPLHEEKVSLGPCLHVAHTACLTAWLAKDASCPVCRVPFVDPLAPGELGELGEAVAEVHVAPTPEQQRIQGAPRFATERHAGLYPPSTLEMDAPPPPPPPPPAVTYNSSALT